MAWDGVFGLQTFAFSGFTDMFYVRFTQNASHQIDNIRLDYGAATVATPEPATLATAGLGLLMGLGYAWRRRRAAVA